MISSPNTTTLHSSEADADADAEAAAQQMVDEFVKTTLTRQELSTLELELSTFVLQHAHHHRPIALVTSGGTAADLEVNSVRCLDNFSTGLRGAISVEEFLRRGYAVLHLWRQGSASPFARVLMQEVGVATANQGLSVDSLGRLLAGDDWLEENQGDVLVQQVLRDEQRQEQQTPNNNMDPWLTEPITPTTAAQHNHQHPPESSSTLLSLHRRLLHSTKLETALQERRSALKEQRLLTIPFRSIEEYLAKLQLITTALRDSQTLALCYMAAAVSDYYIPHTAKSQHKIQSNLGSMTLQLEQVPKTLGLLKRHWSPHAFLVSFKLETDMTILRHKATRAAQTYGCHLVIGNLLHTRHEKVWILTPPPPPSKDNKDDHKQQVNPDDWPFQEVAKPTQQQQQDYNHYSASPQDDSLENAIIDFVVQAHFEYISNHGYYPHNNNNNNNNNNSMDDSPGGALLLDAAILDRHAALMEEKRQRQRQAFRDQLKGHAVTVAGTIVAILLSSAINAALQQRRDANSRR